MDGPYGDLDFTYDPVGNRLTRRLASLGTTTTDTYSYAATSNRLQSVAGGQVRTFTYDAAGNITYDNRSGTGFSYGYNAKNRMESVSINGVVQSEFAYNALGQQVIRRLTVGGQTIHSVHDADGNRVAEYDYDPGTQISTLLREYVWMNGENVAVVEGGVVYYVRTDHIGRPVFATDDSGTKVWEASYLPFGGVHASTGANSDLRFPDQWFQSEAGLHQNWMREYDPTTGRYIQANPLGLVDWASVYGYALQNPGRYVDPRGEAVQFAPWIWNAARWVAGKVFQGAGRATAPVGASIGANIPSTPGVGTPGGVDTVDDARERIAAAEANNQCPDPCDKARVRVDDAKKKNKLGACKGTDLPHVLHEKTAAWGEHCNARKERDRICVGGPQGNATPQGEDIQRFQACKAFARCMAKLSKN